ncbi:hypothetical protein C7S16_0495 [Burkholderia thailandensis]|uniref:Uncharacterized protein n=1 Tax=Burkholderia thailandensis TaxID=57975 RepID=A0AAW9D1D3_BURTH|nr:hypothetical protein [Burkholderia thailandensis]MDW9255951.1 hypothetical protein [Burkholderia thailandensis]
MNGGDAARASLADERGKYAPRRIAQSARAVARRAARPSLGKSV